jgi:hypothetical protein
LTGVSELEHAARWAMASSPRYCDTTNAKTIVGELVRYLQVADYNLREEMVLKIAILTDSIPHLRPDVITSRRDELQDGIDIPLVLLVSLLELLF